MIVYSNYINKSISLFTPIVELKRPSTIVTQDSDYYLAFPCMKEMPNGNLIALYYKATSHSGDANAKTIKIISSDHGKTWTSEEEMFYVAGAHRKDSYISVIGSRVFLIINEGFGSWLRYSDDNAVTWSTKITLSSTYLDGTRCFTHGNIIITPDDDLLMPLWGEHDGSSYTQVSIVKSEDNGLTWTHLSGIDNRLKDTYNMDGGGAEGWLSEPTLIYAPNGKLLCYTRGNGLLYTSIDDGATWDIGVSIGMDFGSPNFLVDGTDLYLIGRRRILLATYFNKDGYNNTLCYIKSTDSGINWGSPVTINIYGGYFEGDGGYGGAVLHEDKIHLIFFTNDGYDSDLGITSDNQQYIRFLDDIKADPNFGDTTKTNVQINYGVAGQTKMKVWAKVGVGAYTDLGDFDGSTFNLLTTPGNTITYKVQAYTGGAYLDETEEASIYIYDPRVSKMLENISYVGESLTETRKLNIHNTIVALRAASLFETQFDALWIMRNRGTKTSKMNWIQDAYNLLGYDNTGTLTFTEDSGYHSDGSKSYLSTRCPGLYTKLFRTRTAPADDSCFGFKLSGTLAISGTHFHGVDVAGVHDHVAMGFGSINTSNYIGLSGVNTFADGVKRVIGYNCLTRSDYSHVKQMSNADISDDIDNVSTDEVEAFVPFLLAENVDGVASNFTTSEEIIEIAWVGKSITQVKFLEFQTIMNNYIANL